MIVGVVIVGVVIAGPVVLAPNTVVAVGGTVVVVVVLTVAGSVVVVVASVGIQYVIRVSRWCHQPRLTMPKLPGNPI
ncbi:MAG: hypothetical protein M3488_13230 [Actinomycetota bacterium]|nr:hypothetical protein [Actinomycetota bacterium]